MYYIIYHIYTYIYIYPSFLISTGQQHHMVHVVKGSCCPPSAATKRAKRQDPTGRRSTRKASPVLGGSFYSIGSMDGIQMPA